MSHYLETDYFYCNHISESDLIDIKNFIIDEPRGYGLVRYLQNEALKDEKSNNARTYIVRDKKDNMIVGYYSLKAGFMADNERRLFLGKRIFDSIPGVELANFAVNGEYKRMNPDYKGLGKIIFSKFVIPTVHQGQEHLGLSILYIFSLPYENLIRNYEKMNFSRLAKFQEKSMHKRIRPYYDTDCIFMYQRI